MRSIAVAAAVACATLGLGVTAASASTANPHAAVAAQVVTAPSAGAPITYRPTFPPVKCTAELEGQTIDEDGVTYWCYYGWQGWGWYSVPPPVTCGCGVPFHTAGKLLNR